MYQNTVKMSHNGRLFRQQIDKSPLIAARVAERMGTAHSTMLSFYERPSLRASVLWKASLALGYNFFFDLGMQLPDMASPLKVDLQRRVGELEKENERLRIENSVYERLLKK